jgi:hypothetical protein
MRTESDYEYDRIRFWTDLALCVGIVGGAASAFVAGAWFAVQRMLGS